VVEKYRNLAVVKKQARQCGTDKNTSFHWCHRFLTLPAATKASRLQEIINADETSFPLSCKGQRHLDRPPRKRGKQIYTRGTGKDQVSVLVVRDRSGATADSILNVLDKKTIELSLWTVLHRLCRTVSCLPYYESRANLNLLTADQKNDLIRLLFGEVRILTARVSESETQLSKDRHNSSTPPSFDELKKTRSLRRPRVPRCAQMEDAGKCSTYQLCVTRPVDIAPCDCNADAVNCTRVNCSQASAERCSMYEPSIRALAVHLTQGQLLPLARIARN